MNSAKAQTFIYLSIAMYLAGLIGLNFETTKDFFRILTPYHLLSSAIILVYFEAEKSKPFWTFLVISYFIGFFIEVLGVNTGMIFGQYAYGKTLGIKVWETPLMIGVNWFILSFTTAKSLTLWSSRFAVLNNTWFFVLKGAAIMTFLDYFAEPPAIYHEMWSWESEIPPIQNYLAWFFVSAILMLIFKRLNLKSLNPLAFPILLLQFLFFCLQSLIL